MDYPEALVINETIMSFNSINIPEIEQVVFLVESLIIISNALLFCYQFIAVPAGFLLDSIVHSMRFYVINHSLNC